MRSVIKQKLARSNQANSDIASPGSRACDPGASHMLSLGVTTAHIEYKALA